ncbi:U2 snRNP complex subunit, variant 2 [Balamuthia mandrillaris]
MRLTADLILTAPSYLNPLKDRELDLRGHKIAVIENLGVTQDQFDTIDLSDNEIQLLENFPLLQRLKTLMLNNNRVFCLASSGLGESLPKLETLILTNNKLEKLEDLEALAQLAPSLRELSLLGNPVTRRPNYRLYLIAKLPRLKVLDFTRVKPQVRLLPHSLARCAVASVISSLLLVHPQ